MLVREAAASSPSHQAGPSWQLTGPWTGGFGLTSLTKHQTNSHNFTVTLMSNSCSTVLCSEKANGRPLRAPLPAIRREKVYSPNHIWCFWSSCALKNADPSDWSNPDTGNAAVVRGGKPGVGRRPLEEVLAAGVWLHKEGQGCDLVFLHARWWTKALPPPHSHLTNSGT